MGIKRNPSVRWVRKKIPKELEGYKVLVEEEPRIVFR